MLGIFGHMDCYTLQCSKLIFSSKALPDPKLCFEVRFTFPHAQTNCGCSGHHPNSQGQKKEVSHYKQQYTQLPFPLATSAPTKLRSLSPSLTLPHRSLPRALLGSSGHLRLMDTAVVENKIHRGKLLSRLLRFQVELHHSLVPWEETQASERQLGITTQPS